MSCVALELRGFRRSVHKHVVPENLQLVGVVCSARVIFGAVGSDTVTRAHLAYEEIRVGKVARKVKQLSG